MTPVQQRYIEEYPPEGPDGDNIDRTVREIEGRLITAARGEGLPQKIYDTFRDLELFYGQPGWRQISLDQRHRLRVALNRAQAAAPFFIVRPYSREQIKVGFEALA